MILCDKCKEEIVIELKQKKLKDDVKKVYFNCDSCNIEYLVYLTSRGIEEKQKQVQKLMIKANREELNTRDRQIYYEEYKRLKNEIRDDMEALKKEYES